MIKTKTKKEALVKLAELEKRLVSVDIDDILDDGYDSGDYRQNQRFCATSSIINKVHKELSFMDIEGVDADTLNTLWRVAWGSANIIHLTEVQYNHAINYIKALREICAEGD